MYSQAMLFLVLGLIVNKELEVFGQKFYFCTAPLHEPIIALTEAALAGPHAKLGHIVSQQGYLKGILVGWLVGRKKMFVSS